MKTDISNRMVKLNGELAKVILNNDKIINELDIFLQSEESGSLEEQQINLKFCNLPENVTNWKEMNCLSYIKHLQKNNFYKNLTKSPGTLMKQTIHQANIDNVFLKDLNSFDALLELNKLLLA